MIGKLLLATRNSGKIAEIVPRLGGVAVSVISLAEIGDTGDVRETGTSFEENAVLKAETLYRKTGIITLADDSGLEVDALGGKPGIHSARFAGEGATDSDNNEKLMNMIAAVPPGRRTARFRCVMALAFSTGTKTFEGIVAGRIASAPTGIHGFGYDPLFIPDGYDRTFGELGRVVKESISHRARALAKVAAFLQTARLNSP